MFFLPFILFCRFFSFGNVLTLIVLYERMVPCFYFWSFIYITLVLALIRKKLRRTSFPCVTRNTHQAALVSISGSAFPMTDLRRRLRVECRTHWGTHQFTHPCHAPGLINNVFSMGLDPPIRMS